MNNSVVFSTLGSSPNLPDDCYIDTNAIVELALNRRYNTDVADFLIAASANNTLITFSDHTLDELLHTIHVSVYEEEAKKAGFTGGWKEYENSGANHGQAVWDKYTEAIATLESYAGDVLLKLENPSPDDIMECVRKLMLHGVAPKDAKHVSIMHLNGVNSVFTLDAGYVRAPNLNIYSPSNGLLKHVIKGSNTIPYQSNIPNPT